MGLRTVQAVLKREDGKIVKELKTKREADKILQFKGTDAEVVMESGYNYQYLYDLLKIEGYDVKVAHPLMVKAIAYAKVKTDKVDARTLADLLRMDMVSECYIPDVEKELVRLLHLLPKGGCHRQVKPKARVKPQCTTGVYGRMLVQ